MTDANRPTLRRIAATAVILAALAGRAQAVRAAEPRDPIQREDLALIETQLARVDRVIDRLAARQARAPKRRVVLDVDQLRADVHAIRAGIQGYLSPPRLLPRAPAALSGEYLELRPGSTP